MSIIIRACAVLHNIVILRKKPLDGHAEADDHPILFASMVQRMARPSETTSATPFSDNFSFLYFCLMQSVLLLL